MIYDCVMYYRGSKRENLKCYLGDNCIVFENFTASNRHNGFNGYTSDSSKRNDTKVFNEEKSR
jgi:hypothetical protein